MLTYKECKATCKEDFQEAKDTCLNRDHACVEICRAERAECREATGLDAAIAQINATLVGAKQTCRATHAEGTPERDQCIDQAQVVAFQQRDDAREAAKSDIKLCRADFKACAKACPPADPPSSVDRVQCKEDAKSAYLTCKETCREDFQVTKDACRNRDHVCVEGCREDRDGCRQPVIDQLLADIAVCNTGPGGRSEDIEECHNLYGDGTPELDTCIDQAQVEAFQCRDGAREDARPGFETCRQAFQSCAGGCPPVGG